MMVYALIILTIVSYLLIVIRIFHGINDQRTVALFTKLKNTFKSKKYDTLNSHPK